MNIAAELQKLIGQEAGPDRRGVKLEHPADLARGDYACHARGKAQELVAKINAAKPDWLEKVEAVGAFVNFYLSPKFFVESISEIVKGKENYGKNNIGNGKKVIVEYSSPNIAKPFTIGHLRSTIIGDAIANLLAFSGYEVIRDNHLGDWGTQFGKQIVAINKFGGEGIEEKIDKSENPVKELVSLYVKFHDEAEKDPALEDEAREWFRKLEQGDAEADRIWRKCIEWSMTEFNKIYQRLGIKFDHFFGESNAIPKIADVYKELKDKGLMKSSDGADVVFFEQHKLPPMIVRKKDGSSIYATRDLATDLIRKKEFGSDIMIINEVGSEQSLYMRQLYETERMLGWFKPEQRIHVAHGLYRFKDGKMSTRRGNVVWLEDVLNDAEARALRLITNKDYGKIEEVAEGVSLLDYSSHFSLDEESGLRYIAGSIAVGALKYNDLKRNSKQDIVFDWNEVMNLKGDSGPYLQYTCVRAKSVLAKATLPKEAFLGSSEKIPRTLEKLPSASLSTVEKLLYRFPEVVERAAADYAPNHLVTYLTELASAFNSYYAQNKIIGSEEEPYRLALTAAVAQVLENGLNLLGIKIPAKM